MARAHLFIRDDDVWTLDKSFRFFFDMAKDCGLPVVYAVIPGKMDQKLIKFLVQAKERKPHLLDIVQHGWKHTNYSCQKGIKYEFGVSRSLESQREDIRRGLKQMRAGFGKNFVPAFVPPYHGFNKQTLQILAEEDFKILSAGKQRLVSKSFMNLPAQVSFSCYEKNKPGIYDVRTVAAQVIKNIHRRFLLGVVTHHKDFSNAHSRKELSRFFDWVLALQAKEEIRILLFSDILKFKGQ